MLVMLSALLLLVLCTSQECMSSSLSFLNSFPHKVQETPGVFCFPEPTTPALPSTVAAFPWLVAEILEGGWSAVTEDVASLLSVAAAG
jgi:hypothetical protein